MPNIFSAAVQFISDLLQGRDRKAVDDLEKKIGISRAQVLARKLGVKGSRSEAPEERRLGRREPEEELERRPGEDGDMIEVSSSNVHSIGYINKTFTLLVRFLAESNGKRSGPGPLYAYKHVPKAVWERAKSAASKGKFVWDSLRIRGTIDGHVYDYELASAGPDEYVPRKATGAGLNPREISQDGRTLRSARPGTGRFG